MKYKLINKLNKDYPPLQQILFNRGLDNNDIRKFLQPSKEDVLNPYGLAGIKDAALCLLKHIVKQDQIFIQVDADCDGYTSSSLLLNYLYRIFPATVKNNISYRLHDDKHHGLIINEIPKEIKLVIAPDSSSNEYEIHKQLKSLGIDIIVLDHHQADIEEDEPAIIINNQTCSYENKTLSGVGIVYKFCKVLDEILKVNYADDYLDLVALGMTADLMDTRNPETRYLIFSGFSKIYNIFFEKLIQKQEFSMQGEINPHTVGWYIAPMINAMTRSGMPIEKECLFKALLDYESIKLVPSTKKGHYNEEELLVDKAIRTCQAVKARQEKNKKEALEVIEKMIDSSIINCMIIIQIEYPIDINLTGLLANSIMGQYNMPVLILNKNGNDWSGSGRGIETEIVQDWRSFIEDSGYAEYAQGHSNAFGVSFTEENLEKFKKYLLSRDDIVIEPYYPVDFIFDNNDNYDNMIFEIAEYQSIWGQGAQEPLIVLQNIPFTKKDIILLGKGTLRLSLKDHETSIIKFNGEDIYNKLMDSFPLDDSLIYLNIVGNCSINNYMGLHPQIKLKDCEVNRVVTYNF